ncbi:hypothetical protein N9444_00985 [Gammaproteobacteria bacterium]|nr:hypothetical protein [Gammaproteobacteria bacterium]
MNTASIFLLLLWFGAHGLIVAVAFRLSGSRVALVLSALMLIIIFLFKPYTYDLKKYSIYFDTGYIETQGWKSPDGDVDFQLYQKDTTGPPFMGAYEYGFRKLAYLTHELLPSGALMPRIDPDYGDLKQRGPPRSDAAIIFIAIVGFGLLLSGVGLFSQRQPIAVVTENARWLLVSVVILGSIFFVLGSQNTLRQFLGFSLILNAMALASLRKYVLTLAILIASGLFHRWAPILGSILVGIVLASEMTLAKGSLREVRAFCPSHSEMLMFAFGCFLAIGIKLIAVLGLFNLAIPFVEELALYLIKEGDHFALERLTVSTKAVILGLLFLTSEAIVGKTNDLEFNKFRTLRRMSFLFIIPLALYSEIFSRVLVIFWLVELLFIIWALSSNQLRSRLAGAAVFCAYGIAPNAINIVIGPQWLYAF